MDKQCSSWVLPSCMMGNASASTYHTHCFCFVCFFLYQEQGTHMQKFCILFYGEFRNSKLA